MARYGPSGGRIADFCHPPLTTLGADTEQVGRSAITLLLAGLDSPAGLDTSSQVVQRAGLIIRESTGPAPTGSAQPRRLPNGKGHP